MANADVPMGLVPYTADGKQYRIRRYPKKSGNAIYKYDAVKADAAGTVDVATNTGALLGVAMEYKAATDTSDIAIMDDPEAVFMIQTAGAIAATGVFQNAKLVATAGDAATGLSAMELDSSDHDTTSTLQLRILGKVPKENNDYGSFVDLLVQINNHQLRAGTTGV